MASTKQLLQELKARNVRKTMAIYGSSALTTIGVVKLFTEVYDLPEVLFKVVAVLLTCGTVSAFLVAWYHGIEGAQKPRIKEIALHALVLCAAIFLSLRVSGSQPAIPRLSGNTIAVLPFENLSDNKEDEYFSDGVTEDILTRLSKISDLNVISRTSTMKYKNSTLGIREIAAALGASAILEGTVRRAGGQVKIVGRLIDAEHDLRLWDGEYDREFKDIFAIQTEVAREIADALKAKLSPDEKVRLEKDATTNLDAYAYYLQGRDYYNRLVKDDNERAIEFFKKAIALDTAYALAYAGLADAYAQRYQRYGYDAAWIDSSIALSKHAITLDPNIPEPYKALGLAYYQHEWYQQATEQYRKALALNPNYAVVYANMGELLDWTGHQDEAIPMIRKSIRLTPGRASDYQKLASAYFSLGLDSVAEALFMKVIELQPSLPAPYSGLSELYTAQGNLKQARLILQPALKKNPDDPLLLVSSGNVELYDHQYDAALAFYQQCYDASPDHPGLATQLAFAMRNTGRIPESESLFDLSAEENLKQIKALSEEGQRRYDLARVYAVRNDTANAMKWLRDAISRGSGIYRLTNQDPLLENLYDNKEFQNLLIQIKSRADLLRARVQEQQNIP